MFENELKNKIPILLAISTCPRCTRIKKFLKMHNIEFKAVDIDLKQLGEKKEIFKFMQPFNPGLSFPTLIVSDSAVLGEDYDAIKEILSL